MKTLLEVIREPLVIVAFVLAVLIVIGAYLGSHYYYGDAEIVDIPESLAFAPSQPRSQTSLELDFGEVSEQVEPPQTELESEVTPSKGISIEEFLAELSEEEQQSLAAEVADKLPRESIHGLGPYPAIPPDFPRQNIWEKLERSYYDGRANINHELINRVLIKYWNQGKKTGAGVHNETNSRVYPLFKDTVYVEWAEVELEDGNRETYLRSYLCHGSLADYEESVERGTQPSWLKVVLYEDGGVDPYSFFDLP